MMSPLPSVGEHLAMISKAHFVLFFLISELISGFKLVTKIEV